MCQFIAILSKNLFIPIANTHLLIKIFNNNFRKKSAYKQVRLKFNIIDRRICEIELSIIQNKSRRRRRPKVLKKNFFEAVCMYFSSKPKKEKRK